MLAVMPVGPRAGQFEAAISAASLRAISAALRPTFMALSMPRLHLASHFDLSSTLSALGMPDAFTPHADLSGISTTPLQIQAVEHGADLKVDEAGTIAAAATGISVEPTAIAVGPSVRVSLDHPFVAFVEDLDSRAILFEARIDNPSMGQP
jgi:serpin B